MHSTLPETSLLPGAGTSAPATEHAGHPSLPSSAPSGENPQFQAATAKKSGSHGASEVVVASDSRKIEAEFQRLLVIIHMDTDTHTHYLTAGEEQSRQRCGSNQST